MKEVIDMHTTVDPGFKTQPVWYTYHRASDGLTQYVNSIIKLSVRYCVRKIGEGIPYRVLPKTLKWVVVYSSMFVFYVLSTARSFRDGTPSYCPLRRM